MSRVKVNAPKRSSQEKASRLLVKEAKEVANLRPHCSSSLGGEQYLDDWLFYDGLMSIFSIKRFIPTFLQRFREEVAKKILCVVFSNWFF